MISVRQTKTENAKEFASEAKKRQVNPERSNTVSIFTNLMFERTSKRNTYHERQYVGL